MSLIKYPIKNYQFTLIIVLMLLLVGFSTLTSMPRAEDPDLMAPSFPVVVVYPGASPKDVEQLIVKPLETRFYGLDNIKRIKTSINNGIAFIFVEYQHGVDFEGKFQELTRELNAAQASELPKDIRYAEAMKIDPTNVSVLQLALVSENASRVKLKELADDLKSELEKIQALKKVEIHGLSDQLIRVDVNPGKLAQMNIPLNQVMDAIGSEAANIPGGSIHAGQKSFSVKTTGNYQSIEHIQNTIIASHEGKNVVLKDVAAVYADFAPETHITRMNGYRGVFATAAQKEGQNISETQKKYLKVISDFKSKLPVNVDLVMNFDQAQNVNNRLSGLAKDFGIAIGLVLITLLPLGVRASLVVMIAIPLSLAIGIISLNVFGFSLNQLSIVGFVVALGLVVDDSIVVVENVERWLREGHSRLDAAVKGTKQIALAVVNCTVTLVIAFMPLMFLPELAGDFIRSMPAAVIGSVMGSMFVALLVVPFLSSLILKPHAHEGGNVVLRTFQKVIHASYGVFLDKALKRPGFTALIALAIFLASLAVIPKLGFSLFPQSEKPQFMITITPPPQSNIKHSDSLARIVEDELRKFEEVKYFATNVGKGNPRVYYNLNQANEREDYAEIFVQLQDHINSDEKNRIIDSLRLTFDHFLGAKIECKNFEQGVPILSPVEIRIFGDNLDTLRNLAGKAEKLLYATPGTSYISNPVVNNKSDLKVKVNREKAMALGVPSIAIDRTVRVALAGYDVATYTDPKTDNNDYKIRLSIPHDARPDMTIFDDIFINNVQGAAIPLSQLATLEMESSPSTISHINKTRVVYVNSFVQKGFTNDQVINKVIAQMDEMELPAGYHYEMGGEIESRQEAFGGFGTVVLITGCLFIAVLVLAFKTFKSTLIVLSVIPLGIVGAVAALWVTGNPLSFVAIIGIVALAGIEVKNTILLVDFTNQLREEGMELNEAIETAGELRFLPIILTSLTAIGGLMPIAWSSNPMISPLAIVMIGGLISSTLLSRIVTPVIYKLIPPKIESKKIKDYSA